MTASLSVTNTPRRCRSLLMCKKTRTRSFADCG